MFHIISLMNLVVTAAFLLAVIFAVAAAAARPLERGLRSSSPVLKKKQQTSDNNNNNKAHSIRLYRDHRVHIETGKTLRLTREQQQRRIARRFGNHLRQFSEQTQKDLGFTAEQQQQQQQPQHELPVQGDVWPVSIYWTVVQVGTPPASYPVCIDSGSDALFLVSTNCTGCSGGVNIPYDSSASSTSLPLGSPFSYSYQTCVPWDPTQTCTISGTYYADVVSLAGYDPVPIKLGAIESQSAEFYQFKIINGIMGMTTTSYDPTHRGSTDDTGNVFEQVCEVHGGGNESGCLDAVWSICMNAQGILSNGTMTVGTIDRRLAVNGDVDSYWVKNIYAGSPMVGNLVKGMSIQPSKKQKQQQRAAGGNNNNNKAATSSTSSFSSSSSSYPLPNFTAQSAILDTGTNNVLLPSALFQQVRDAVCADATLAQCDVLFNDPTACFPLSQEQIDAYPTILFHLAGENNVTIELKPADYFLLSSPIAKKSNDYCFGIGDGDYYFILGDTIMQNSYLIFDQKRGRVSWAPVNNEMCGSV